MKKFGFAFVVSMVAVSSAMAFGTINTLGQNAEHERITRHALGCGVAGGPAAGACFKDKALQDLAGRTGTWGAVGAPDNPTNGRTGDPKSHCDDGDFFNTPGYPQTAAAAKAALDACRQWMITNLNSAVAKAAPLVSNHKLVDAEIPTVFNCTFNYTKGRAYCNVLEDFGAALHASQDFYSHSNWADQADATKPISVSNPPGLGNTARAPWLNLRTASPAFPAGLITGCFAGLPPNGTSGCPNRVTHLVLNKDKGTIDPSIGAGTTTRGALAGNFKRAVEAAIDDTRDKWAHLREKLVATYGSQDGGLMICALVNGPDYAANCK